MILLSKNSKAILLFKAYGIVVYNFFLKKSQYYTKARMEAYQFKKLRKTLIDAQKVPYYQRLFREINFNPERDFQTLADLEKIPVLTKDQIRANFNDLINPAYKGFAVKYYTSGSTGSPMPMLLTPFTIAIDKAMIFRHHSWCTGKFRPRIFSLRSYVRKSEKEPLFRYNWFENNYYFSAYNLDKESAPFYIEQLIKLNPDIIRGYPSSIAFLCDYLSKEDVKKLTNLRGIFTSSETLSDIEREKIINKFGPVLFNWYGMTEPAIIIKEGPDHDGMHLCLEYGYPEYSDTENAHIKKLITTSLHNSAMPFIRYETGDMVELANSTTSSAPSGINLPKIRTVLGRKDDYIIGEKGNKIPSVNFYTLFRTYEEIIGFQIVQFTTKEILLLLKTRHPLTQEQKQVLLEGFLQRTGKLPVYLKETDKFITNSDGKTLVVVKKAGSYKLTNFEEYTLSTQRAWDNHKHHINSYKLDWNEADVTPLTSINKILSGVFETDHYIKWYPKTVHEELMVELCKYCDNLSRENILVTHGSDNALRMILQSFTEKGNQFLNLKPTYDNFRAQANAFGLEEVSVEVSAADDSSVNRIIQCIEEEDIRLVYLCNPNNPIGYQFSNEQLDRIATACKAKNALVIVDEAYTEFAGKNAIPLVRKYDNLVIARTFSKAFGLAGLRLGYILAQESVITTLTKIYNPKDVTMLAALAGTHLLRNFDSVQAYINEVNDNKKKFYAHCEANQVKYFPSEGNFVSYKVDSTSDYLAFLEQNNIYLRDRSKYFNDSFVRATIGAKESFEIFLEKHDQYLKQKN